MTLLGAVVHLMKYAFQSFWQPFEATKAISKGILLKSSVPILEPLVACCSGLKIKVAWNILSSGNYLSNEHKYMFVLSKNG